MKSDELQCYYNNVHYRIITTVDSFSMTITVFDHLIYIRLVALSHVWGLVRVVAVE
jgi:hypothetical protein